MTGLAVKLSVPTGRPVVVVAQRRFGAHAARVAGAVGVAEAAAAPTEAQSRAKDRRTLRAGQLTASMVRGLSRVAAGQPVQTSTRDGLVARGLVGRDAAGRLRLTDAGRST